MDEVLAVIIPGNDLSNDKNRNGEMDFLFLSKDKEYKKIKNDDEFERFKNNIKDYIFDKDTEEDYHIYHVVDYLKNEFSKKFKFMDFSKFNPNNQYTLYTLLASMGDIVLINSLYNSMLMMPDKKMITDEQIDSLERLSSLINEKMNFFVEFYDNKRNLTDSYEGDLSGLLEYIKEQMKGIRY